MSPTRSALPLLLALLVVAAVAFADPVPVANPGFEADFVANGTFPIFTPIGWQPYDPFFILDGNNNSIGVLNPTGTTYFPAAPEGSNVALTFLAATIGAGEAGLRQVLTSDLQPSTIYRLSVQVGDIASGTGLPPFDVYGYFALDGFPGYRIELRAGDELLAFDHNGLDPLLEDGQFALSTIRAAIPAGHAALDQPLEIRLINLNLPDPLGRPGIEVDFDAVALDAVAAGAGEVLDLLDCLSGPAVAYGCPPEPTAAFDFDDDGDIDMQDVARAARLP